MPLKVLRRDADHCVMNHSRRSRSRAHTVVSLLLPLLAVVVLASCAASGSAEVSTTETRPLRSKAMSASESPPPSPVAVTSTTVPAAMPSVPVVRDTHILYSARPPGQETHEIYRMRVDGSEPIRLTWDPSVEHFWPRPSPDGTTILFYTAAPGETVTEIDTNNLWAMAYDGSDQRMLIADGTHGWTRQGHVEWSPDGGRLIMSAGDPLTTELYVTDAEGRSPVRVTNRGSHMAIDPSWTPDGASALFIGCPAENLTCWWWEYEVYRVDVSTGTEQRLTNDAFPDFDPYMSPDGSRIVWLRCTGMFPFGPWGIFGAPTTQVPVQPAAIVDDGNMNSSVDFSSDGTTMLFSRHVIGVTTWQSAATVHLDGSGLGFVGGVPAPSGQGTPVYWP